MARRRAYSASRSSRAWIVNAGSSASPKLRRTPFYGETQSGLLVCDKVSLLHDDGPLRIIKILQPRHARSRTEAAANAALRTFKRFCVRWVRFSGYNLVGSSMRFGSRTLLSALPLSISFALSACATHSPQPGRSPVLFSNQVAPQRPGPVHERRPVHATHPALPSAIVSRKMHPEEKEKLFRGFVEWQGTRDDNR